MHVQADEVPYPTIDTLRRKFYTLCKSLRKSRVEYPDDPKTWYMYNIQSCDIDILELLSAAEDEYAAVERGEEQRTESIRKAAEDSKAMTTVMRDNMLLRKGRQTSTPVSPSGSVNTSSSSSNDNPLLITGPVEQAAYAAEQLENIDLTEEPTPKRRRTAYKQLLIAERMAIAAEQRNKVADGIKESLQSLAASYQRYIEFKMKGHHSIVRYSSNVGGITPNLLLAPAPYKQVWQFVNNTLGIYDIGDIIFHILLSLYIVGPPSRAPHGP